MKCEVIKGFIDRVTFASYSVGDVITVTKSRYNEIQAVGNYLQPVKILDEPAESEAE